jgi:hypothetical protein
LGPKGKLVVRKAVPILIVASSAVAVLVAFAAYLIYSAAHGEPEFYRAAIALGKEEQQAASDAFVTKALALASDIQTKHRWQVSFSNAEINGWLAVDVPTNLPDAIPPEVHQPRIQIQPGEATIACHLKNDDIDAVVSIKLDVFVSSPHEIAIRFRGATLGTLPVPINKLLEPIGEAAAQLELPLVWRQEEGDPVAVILLENGGSEEPRGLQLEAIELGDSELLIAGRNHNRSQQSDVLAQEEDAPSEKSAAVESDKVQR